MCTHTSTSEHVHAHTSPHVHIHAHMYIHIHMLAHMHVHAQTHAHTYMCVHMQTDTYTSMHMPILIHTHTNTHMHSHVHMHACTHTPPYPCTHIRIHTHRHQECGLKQKTECLPSHTCKTPLLAGGGRDMPAAPISPLHAPAEQAQLSLHLGVRPNLGLRPHTSTQELQLPSPTRTLPLSPYPGCFFRPPFVGRGFTTQACPQAPSPVPCTNCTVVSDWGINSIMPKLACVPLSFAASLSYDVDALAEFYLF